MNGGRETIKVLLVEDSASDARLIIEALKQSNTVVFEVEHIESLAGCRDCLDKKNPDIILLDMGLPDSQWPRTLFDVVSKTSIPVIVLTGMDDEDLAIRSLQEGAQDYIVKRNIDNSLSRMIRHAIERQKLKMLVEQYAEAVMESEMRVRTIISKNADGVIVLNKDGIVRFMNPAAEALFECRSDEMRGKPFHFIACPGNGPMEVAIKHENGESVIAEARSVETEWVGEEVCILTVRDITERKRAEEKLRLSSKVIESMLEGVFVTGSRFDIHTVNPAFEAITEWRDEEVTGMSPDFMGAGRYEAWTYEQIRNSLSKHGRWQGEVWNRRKSGDVYPAWLTVSAIKDEEDKIENYVWVFTDITQRKLVEDHFRNMAHYDMLTGLPNRTFFNDLLAKAVAQARRNRQKLAVLFIDLDKFKPVNDNLGHDVGDLLLQDVARRLKLCVRESDTVARIGGDEFVVIITDVKEPRDARVVAEKIIAAAGDAFYPKGHKCDIGASIGISIYPEGGADIKELVKNADMAMYAAKERGGSCFKIYGQ
jgi:diguanylate cyclase (GGDEF)-like protein/PAS domain S-box-containing protein